MSPPLIAPVEDVSDDVRETLQRALYHDGSPLRLFTTLAHHPRLLKRTILLGGVFMTGGGLPTREREIVIMRTGWRTGCEYEFGHHQIIGPREGLTRAEVLRLTDEDTDGWSRHDRTLVDMVDQLCLHDRVEPDTLGDLKARWDDAQVLELLALSGLYRLIAGIVNSVGIDPEPGVPGWPSED